MKGRVSKDGGLIPELNKYYKNLRERTMLPSPVTADSTNSTNEKVFN